MQFANRITAEIENQILEKLNGSGLVADPFPYIYIEDFLPKSLFDYIVSIMPEDRYLSPFSDKKYVTHTKPIPNKILLTIYNSSIKYLELDGVPHREEIINLHKWYSSFLKKAIANKLQVSLDNEKDDDLLYNIDTPGFFKVPHTDTPQKIFSALLYITNSKVGTSIHRPIDTTFTDSVGYDLPPRMFNKIFTTEHKPNNMFAFVRTDNSFHSVEKLSSDERRVGLHYAVRRK